MKLKDYSVTQRDFELMYDGELDLYATLPKVEAADMKVYYASEFYISHTDASQKWSDKIYQVVKKFTIRSKVNLLNSFPLKEKSLLDIGCGTGEFLLSAQSQNWKVVGVEPNVSARELVLSKLKNVQIYNSIHNLINNPQHEKFDVITLWHVLEHVPDYDEYLEMIKNLLKPEGVLIIAVPNFKSFDANYYQNFWAAYDVPRHVWHFSKTAVSKIVQTHQMKVEKILPMYFDAFYVSLLSQKYKTGKSNPIMAFCIGLLSNLKAIRSKEYSSQVFIIKRVKNEI